MLFFRQFQHLLPSGKAWSLVADKTIRKFFIGLSGTFSDARDYVDDVWADMHPDTTSELAEWENQFGLPRAATDTDRRANIKAAWAATGGQSPSYMQGVLQAAGFDVYVHDWWSSGPAPYVARDPRSYTTIPTVGDDLCSALPSQPQCTGDLTAAQPQCSGLLANNPRYLVNDTLNRLPPPLIPGDSSTWPYFLYIGTETFGGDAVVDEDRRTEFEALALKLSPNHVWIVLMIDYQPIVTGSFYYGPGTNGWSESAWA